MMRNVFIATLLLLGMVVASDIVCTGNAAPNLRTDLFLNCTTLPAPSMCWAVVSDNSTPPNIIGFYPKDAFTYDRELIYSSDDGKFIVSIYVSEPQYALSYAYEVEVNCVANDSSSNNTVFSFQPVTYASPDWIAYWGIYLKDNMGFAFAVLLGIVVAVAVVGYIIKKALGG